MLLAIACTSEDAAPTATTTIEAPLTAVPTRATTPRPTATTRAPFILQTPTPFPTAEAMAPDRILETNARRTGLPEVDRVLDALFGDDQAALDALVRTQSAVCHEEVQGLGDMEVCPEGVEGGTTVEFLPRGSCHGYPWHSRPFYSVLDGSTVALLAVLRLPQPINDYLYWPDGGYLIVFVGSHGDPANAFAVYVADGMIVRSQDGCNSVTSLLERGGNSPDYLLEPFELPD
jgi:hypothetical protein